MWFATQTTPQISTLPVSFTRGVAVLVHRIARLSAALVAAATTLSVNPTLVSAQSLSVNSERSSKSSQSNSGPSNSRSSNNGPSSYMPRTLTPAQISADLAQLRQSLEQVHAGYDRYVPRRVMDTAFARLERRGTTAMTDVEFYGEVALLLAKIRCGHTKAELPEALADFRERNATMLPVRVRVFGERLFVSASNGVGADQIAVGTEILGINGISAADIITKLSRFAAVDGFTDFSRATLLERDSDLIGSDLDHYWPIEFGFANEWTLALKSAAGATRTVTLAPLTFAEWTALTGDVPQVDFRNGTRFKMLDDTTAALTIRSFVNYRTPVNVDSLYSSMFSPLKAKHVRHLIIDLRENGGGSDEASAGLIRYLADRSIQPLRTVRRRTIRIDSALSTAFDTWGDRAQIFSPAESLFMARNDGWFVERGSDEQLTPSPVAFAGRVSVLVGRRNQSGTTMLLAVLQEMGARTHKLRLVGEETAGSAEGPTAGQILFLRLPNSGIRVRVPLERSDVNVAVTVFGMGVFPDIDATQSLADFRAGVDRALRVARTMPWTPVASLLAPTVGLMRGELEYRDYRSGAIVKLPTSMHTSPIGTTGAFRQRTIYDDGPGKTIYSTDEIRVDGNRWIEGAGTVEGTPDTTQSTLRIVSRRPSATGQLLELRGSGTDDNKRVEFRYTVTLGPGQFIRKKEFRQGAKEWEYRHTYRFSRVSSK